jgi:hypothetical protein
VLAIRISISHGVVPGIVFGLVVVGLPVLISAGWRPPSGILVRTVIFCLYQPVLERWQVVAWEPG